MVCALLRTHANIQNWGWWGCYKLADAQKGKPAGCTICNRISCGYKVYTFYSDSSYNGLLHARSFSTKASFQAYETIQIRKQNVCQSETAKVEHRQLSLKNYFRNNIIFFEGHFIDFHFWTESVFLKDHLLDLNFWTESPLFNYKGNP